MACVAANIAIDKARAEREAALYDYDPVLRRHTLKR
jgi:hypothetical protein